MDEEIKAVYKFMILLKDEDRLDPAGVYEALKHDEWWRFDDRDRCTKFIYKYYNRKQEGFEFHFEY
ncbi:MAG: hypothetical protein ACXAC5_04720 [Promethearchaeota archaeon]|jgi:hypothetical protein